MTLIDDIAITRSLYRYFVEGDCYMLLFFLTPFGDSEPQKQLFSIKTSGVHYINSDIANPDKANTYKTFFSTTMHWLNKMQATRSFVIYIARPNRFSSTSPCKLRVSPPKENDLYLHTPNPFTLVLLSGSSGLV